MTEIKIIFRFNISEIVYPPIEEIVYSEKKVNIISGDRIRNEFLKSENTIANKINNFINNGELRSHREGPLTRPEEYKEAVVYRERPFFECYIDNI